MSEVEPSLSKDMSEENELKVRKKVDNSECPSLSMQDGEMEDSVNGNLGRRKKCKSAAVLLGLVKSRARLAKRACDSRVEDLDNFYKPQREKMIKLEVSANVVSKDIIKLKKKSIHFSDSSLVNTDSTIKKDWFKPFDLGWRREVVHRGTSKSVSSSKPNADVYYFTPGQVKLRSMPEIVDYLKRISSSLSSDCFTFNKEPIYHEPYEVVRLAGVPKGRKVSSTASPVASKQSNSEVSVDSTKLQESNSSCKATSSADSSILNSEYKQKKAFTVQPLPATSDNLCVPKVHKASSNASPVTSTQASIEVSVDSTNLHESNSNFKATSSAVSSVLKSQYRQKKAFTVQPLPVTSDKLRVPKGRKASSNASPVTSTQSNIEVSVDSTNLHESNSNFKATSSAVSSVLKSQYRQKKAFTVQPLPATSDKLRVPKGRKASSNASPVTSTQSNIEVSVDSTNLHESNSNFNATSSTVSSVLKSQYRQKKKVQPSPATSDKLCVPKSRKAAADASPVTSTQSNFEVSTNLQESNLNVKATSSAVAVSSVLKSQYRQKKAFTVQSLSATPDTITPIVCRRSASMRVKLASSYGSMSKKTFAAETIKTSKAPLSSTSGIVQGSSVQYTKVLNPVAKPSKTSVSFKHVVSDERKKLAKCVISIDLKEVTSRSCGPMKHNSDEPISSSPDQQTSIQTESGSSDVSKPSKVTSVGSPPVVTSAAVYSLPSQIDVKVTPVFCITRSSSACKVTEVQHPKCSSALLQKHDLKTTLLTVNTSVCDTTKSVTYPEAPVTLSSKNLTNTSLGLRPCGLDCAGRFGVPPSLYCTMCMSAFHPECAGFSYFAHKSGFCCKSCQQLQRELIVTKYSSYSRCVLSSPDVSKTSVKPSIQQQPPDVTLAQHSTLSYKPEIVKLARNEAEKTHSTLPVVTVEENKSLGNLSMMSESVVSSLPSTEPVVSSIPSTEPVVSSIENDIRSQPLLGLNCEPGTNDESQILILPAVVQCILNMSSPLEVSFEGKRFIIPSSCCTISETEITLRLPGRMLSQDYLTGSARPFICEVLPGNKKSNQVLKICPMVNGK